MKFKPHAYQAACIEKVLALPAVGLFLDKGGRGDLAKGM